MTSVLFLDIDGVLNSVDWWRRRSGANPHPLYSFEDRLEHDLDPSAVGLLNELVVRTSCEVVISSTWRLHGQYRVMAALVSRGFIGRVIGCTPVLNQGDSTSRRGIEIQAWLDQGIKPESFAIVDDDSDMGPLLPKLVKTSNRHGLEREHVERLVEMLGTPERAAQADCRLAAEIGLEVVGG